MSTTVNITESVENITVSFTDAGENVTVRLNEAARGPTGPQGPPGSDATVTATNVAAVINSAAENTTPANDDRLAITDSAASHALKKLTWANLKATLKTYLDGLYSALGHTHPWSEINKTGAVPSDVGAGTIATQDANNVAITGGTISGLTSLSTSGNADVTGYLSAAGGTLYADHVTNRVGVGTTSPTAKLDVNGTFNAVGNATIGGTLTVTGQTELSSSQAAATANSVMTRALGDTRYATKIAVKTNNEDRSSANTGDVLTADADLVIPLEANAVYEVEIMLPYWCSTTVTQGINVSLSGPSGWQLEGFVDIVASAAFVATGRRFTQGAQRGVGNGNQSGEAQWRLKGTIFTGASSGNVTVLWAQFAASSNATRLLKGGYIAVTKKI